MRDLGHAAPCAHRGLRHRRAAHRRQCAHPTPATADWLGREEQEIIRPAIVEAFSKGVLAFGPFAADGLFAGGGYAKYDGILAMYHDQGLAPFKSLSPDGVNFTAGLSAVRTSPDHGTAFDIAGKDKADPQSMRNAIYAAIDIAEHRRAWAEWTRLQTMMVNEYGLNLADLSARQHLMQQCERYFFGDAEGVQVPENFVPPKP